MKLQFSLMIAMAFVLSAFNYTTYPKTLASTSYEVTVDEDIPIERTVYVPKKTIIPPVKLDVKEIVEVEQEPEFVEEKKPDIVEKVVEVVPIQKELPPIPKPQAKKKIIKPIIVVEPEEPEVEPILFAVDEMPRYPACEGEDMDSKARQKCSLKALKMFLRDKLNYPAIARENGVEGTAVLTFVVEKDGSITDLQIKHDPGAGLGIEALRVAKLMSNWIPGKQRGRAVRVRFTLPVKFKLS